MQGSSLTASISKLQVTEDWTTEHYEDMIRYELQIVIEIHFDLLQIIIDFIQDFE